MLIGENAPLASELRKWLEEHPEYEIAPGYDMPDEQENSGDEDEDKEEKEEEKLDPEQNPDAVIAKYVL